MKLEIWMYKQALELYPKAYREQFGQPMLETYTDGLSAAKLEGKTLGFHWNTVLDTIKSVSRATIEVKNADPLARVTAVLGLLLVLITFTANIFPQTGDLATQVANPIALLFLIGLAVISKHLHEIRQKWLFPSFAVLTVINALIFAFVNLFHADSLTAFFLPELNLDANTGIRILSYVYKGIPLLGASLFAIGIVLDFVQTRRINPIYLFVLIYIPMVLISVSMQRILSKNTFMLLVIGIQTSFSIGLLLILLFISLRLWQQPRAAPRVIKAT